MEQRAEVLEFWWLPERESAQDWLVGVGHHRPLTEKDQPSLRIPNQGQPVLPDWWHSIDEQRELAKPFQPYPLHFLPVWCSACQNKNVYRTLRLFPTDPAREPILGPFLVDIDNEDPITRVCDLEDALAVARRVLSLAMGQRNLGEEHVRVFFSGQKGFNIEIRPEALGIQGAFDEQTELSAEKLGLLIGRLRRENAVRYPTRNAVSNAGIAIDRIYAYVDGRPVVRHPYIRLPGSINCWVEAETGETSRLRMHLSLEELHRLPLEAIPARAEAPQSWLEDHHGGNPTKPISD